MQANARVITGLEKTGCNKQLNRQDCLTVISHLLHYPQSDYFELLESAIGSIERGKQNSSETMQELCTKLSPLLEEFRKSCSELSIDRLAEIYTRTFDLAPVCIPYISSYIYGDENFERGTLMSQLAELYEKDGYDSKAELPDHIAVLLGYANYFSSEELFDLIEYCLAKSVKQMSDALRDAENLFYPIMKVVEEIIEHERGKLL